MISPTKSATIGVECWREFWRSQFNCSVALPFELGTKARRENFTLHHAFPKFQSSLVSYTIDAGYAIAYAWITLTAVQLNKVFEMQVVVRRSIRLLMDVIFKNILKRQF